MSLFGDSDEPVGATIPSKSRLSLFDDEPSSTPGSKSSLFADDDDVSGGSPWGTSLPKKLDRGGLLKNLLPTSDVPESYIDIFDDILKDGNESNGRLSGTGVTKLLDAADLGPEKSSWIMKIISPNSQPQDLERNEVNVLLALIGLAQEEEDVHDVTLDGVDERRRNLPVPKLAGLTNLPTANVESSATDESTTKPTQRPATPPSVPSIHNSLSPPQSRMLRKDSLEFPEADPWGSPALHKGHNHAIPRPNGAPTNGVREPVRTVSGFTNTSTGPSNEDRRQQSRSAPMEPASGGWGSYDANPNFNNSTTPPVGGSGGFGGDGGEGERPEEAAPPARTFGGGRVTSNGAEENIVVTLLAEKEGMFLFQHHNYQVSSVRRGSKVVRRYSDFVWLLDCLQKRFPFRQLPLLPPKRVAVNGNHLAAESSFMEKRRRGLARFSNALVRHPVLSQEQLVIMFLTVPTHQELAVWRKQATISVQEEFVGRPLPPGLEDSLPPTLNDLFAQTRTGIRRSAEAYVNMCNLMDRLAKRNEGLAADHLRMALCLQSLTDVSQDTYAIDTNDVPLLNEGLHSTAKHLSNSQNILEDEAKAWDQGVLEDLKKQRDSLVSMRDMFERRDRYDKDNIPYLERRIENNENKLVTIRSKPENMVKPGEIEKVTEAIIKDKESIVAQHARGIFIKECIRDELSYFQSTQYNISRLSQDWAQERVKYSELQAHNWRQLEEELESMPLGD
ncbi:Bcmvp1 [Botrytis cinerea B05.10]|uniref:Sorting nexin MVP1 n=1 Tax=Botryotinia fuckeliana (strain B05.10) TaxID=332648 RepID=A0A384JPL8_BOTFB|nr:Bcmvp1 [Botrytis cinerea B05.10]ATZ52304.1 Bcmvp1 [Botrytis cinerea B05.10]